MRAAWAMAAVLCAGAARAQDRVKPPAVPPPREEARKPLSPEDAEIVKQLALLERLELLRNLDLFEKDEDAKQTKDERPQ